MSDLTAVEIAAFYDTAHKRDPNSLVEIHWTDKQNVAHRWVGSITKVTSRTLTVRFFHEKGMETSLPSYLEERSSSYQLARFLGAVENSNVPTSMLKFQDPPPDDEEEKKKKRSRKEDPCDPNKELLQLWDSTVNSGGVPFELVAEGLKIPMNVDTQWSIFYPNKWITEDLSDEEERWDKLYAEFYREYSVAFKSQIKVTEHQYAKHTLKIYLFHSFKKCVDEEGNAGLKRMIPSSKDDYRPFFVASLNFLTSLALGSPMGRDDCLNKGLSDFEEGKVDFRKLFFKVDKSQPHDPITSTQASATLATGTSSSDHSAMMKRLTQLEKNQMEISHLSASTPPGSFRFFSQRGGRGGGRGMPGRRRY